VNIAGGFAGCGVDGAADVEVVEGFASVPDVTIRTCGKDLVRSRTVFALNFFTILLILFYS